MPTLTRHLIERHWQDAGKKPVLLFEHGQAQTPPDLSQVLEYQASAWPAPPELIPCFEPIPVEVPEVHIPLQTDENWLGWLLQTLIEPEFPPEPIEVIEVAAEQGSALVIIEESQPEPELQPATIEPDFPALHQFFSFSWLSWERTLHRASQFAYAGAIAMVVLFFTPMVVIEGGAAMSKVQNHVASLSIQSQTPPDVAVLPEPTPTLAPEINSPEDYFSIKIPSLKIESRVIPNVNPSDSEEYETALKVGVAHAFGTGLPDDLSLNKTTYLFAHSTNAIFNIKRYNAQFYALKDAKPGDEITIRYWGKDYTYAIEEIKIVDADDTTYLAAQTETPLLILQTCYPPGTTWKRLLVIAKPVTPQP